MGVSKNNGIPKSYVLIGFSMNKNHPFWGTLILVQHPYKESIKSIATSPDLGLPKIAFWKGNHFISGKSRLVKYHTLARLNGTLIRSNKAGRK